MVKNIMSIWHEFNPRSTKSINDDLRSIPDLNKQRIIEYLDNATVKLLSVHRGIDVVSGQTLEFTECILTDGEYSWSNTLGYYVEKYNLNLPLDFVAKILKREEY